ncbi:MAG: hypothetical protein KDB91_07300 [Bacteroidales bacterium]|nr:hypothetical protein [Bacteroidales bacterium]
MGTILYVIVPIPASDSHDRHCRHATVIAAGSSLFLLPFLVCLSARRLTAFLFRYHFCFPYSPFGFPGVHNVMRRYEPLKHDTPLRDSCCHARIISILSSPVRLA